MPRLRSRAVSVAGDSPRRRLSFSLPSRKRRRAATTAAEAIGSDGEAGAAAVPGERPASAVLHAPVPMKEIAVSELFYHPDDARAQHDGFHGRVTPEQEVALSELDAALAEQNVDLSAIVGYGDGGATKEPERLMLLRFLRANDFKVPKALAHVVENVQWREAQGLRDLLAQSPQEVLGCDPEKVNQFFPHWNFGNDRMGRPILCKQYGGFEVWELVKLTTIEKMARSHLWEQEKTLQQMRRSTLQNGQIVDSFVIIIDVGGMRFGQVTKDFLTLMKQVAHVDQRMFPECLGAMFILNTPGLFSTVWRMFTPLLDPRTVAKIRIFSKPKDWQPALLEICDASVLPPEYGGTGTPLAQLPSASTTCHLGVNAPFLPPELAAHRSFSGGAASSAAANAADRRRSRRYGAEGLAAAAVAAAAPAASDPGVLSSVFSALGAWWHGVVEDDKSSVNSDEFFDVMAQMEGFEELGASADAPRGPSADAEENDQIPPNLPPSHHNRRNSFGGMRPASLRFLNHQRRSLSRNGSDMDTVPVGSVAPESRVLGDFAASVGHRITRGCGLLCSPALSRLVKLDVEELATCNNIVNGIFISLSIMAISFGAYMISDMLWVADLVVWMMWCAVVIICLGSLVLVLSLVGLAATRGRDRASLTMHVSALVLLSVITIVTASCSFALAAGDNIVARISWSAVTKSGALPPDMTEAQFTSRARSNFLLVGSGALVLGLFAMLPCLLGAALVIKIGRQAPTSVRARLAAHEGQLRRALQEGTVIAFAFALVCIGYGSYALYYTLELALGECAGIVFMLLVEGVMIVVLSALAIWASASADVWPFNLHLLGSSVTWALLVCWSGYTFMYLNRVGNDVEKQWEYLQTITAQTEDIVTVRLKVQLLVAGILQLVTSFCLSLAIWCSSQLRRSILRHGPLVPLPLGGFASGAPLSPVYIRPSRSERLMVAWASLRGLCALFVEGTFVIFNGYLTDNNDVWATAFWQAWGKVDSRYIESDSYIVAMEGITVLLLGPALLFYAWAAYTRRRFRHILGALLSCSLITLGVAAFGQEVADTFENTAGQSSTAVFVCVYLPVTIIGGVVPCLVMWYNVRHLYKRVAVAEVQYARLVEQHDRLRKYAAARGGCPPEICGPGGASTDDPQNFDHPSASSADAGNGRTTVTNPSNGRRSNNNNNNNNGGGGGNAAIDDEELLLESAAAAAAGGLGGGGGKKLFRIPEGAGAARGVTSVVDNLSECGDMDRTEGLSSPPRQGRVGLAAASSALAGASAGNAASHPLGAEHANSLSLDNASFSGVRPGGSRTLSPPAANNNSKALPSPNMRSPRFWQRAKLLRGSRGGNREQDLNASNPHTLSSTTGSAQQGGSNSTAPNPELAKSWHSGMTMPSAAARGGSPKARFLRGRAPADHSAQAGAAAGSTTSSTSAARPRLFSGSNAERDARKTSSGGASARSHGVLPLHEAHTRSEPPPGVRSTIVYLPELTDLRNSSNEQADGFDHHEDGDSDVEAGLSTAKPGGGGDVFSSARGDA